MIIETVRFGELEIDPETILEMPEGLVGIDKAKRFCLLQESSDSAFKWLQMVDEPGLAFVVINPYDFFPDYELEVCESDAELLGMEAPEDAFVLALLTLGPEGREITANLVAPVVIGTKTRRAKQVILEDERYTTKHPLVGDALQATDSAAG
ncbi:MAG: flagellar assembly protein FliW [Armatimonadetes bacterium]|nr:flagellar assembly protein FliW [Armatimonadota bacterium]NIM24354.1 flagellar assembly protein FliW [Armatimonadota bacterium]NIM68223.1 flagellar assembly protein FliW [Armatimonadota bacterium]NIM75124.1 flagellar assembly protein FliW [Armatimonadota bacterium]NIN06428.1 flagellar assembly protein FliW [Armatimonadota bacterium]